MECSQAFFVIQRHYDGELSNEEQLMLDQHLLTCAVCQQEFDEYGDFFGDIACLNLQVEHRDVLSHTLERIEEATRKRKMDIWWRVGAVAASFVIITWSAFFSLTEAGQTMGGQVAKIFQDHPVGPVAVGEQAEEQTLVTHVTNDPTEASEAIQGIRQTVSFPLLELQDKRLVLESTYLYDKRMVDLKYTVSNSDGLNADTIYFLATTENELIKKSHNNLGVYQFTGSMQAGDFVWATVGEHALTAEINNVIYQLYSPFLTTKELVSYASNMKKAEPY